MSVDSAENTSGWGTSQSASTYENNGTNQWLVNHTSMNSDKVCGSWAQAVSGDTSTSNSNIPNQSSVKLNASNPNELLIADENGSQSNNQTLMSSHFSFDELDPNDLYSTKWGKSVINHDNAWDLNPSSANNDQNSTLASSASQAGSGFKSAIDQQMRNNNGTELWENNLRQTKEQQGNSLGCGTTVTGLDLQQSSNQQQIDQQNLVDTQSSSWSKLVPNQSAAAASNCFGGTWGEEEDLTNVWTGIPNSNSSNSLTNQANQMNVNSNSSTSNVFNNRQQSNSINDKANNLQLMSNTNSNKNWISSDDNWGESIKTGNEWEPDMGMINANSALTPKAQSPQDAAENWAFYQNKLNPTAHVSSQGTAANWSNELENKATIVSDSDIDNGTSLWGNPQAQGQNKVLLWKEREENKLRNNNQAMISNVEQWKKYPLNGNQINNNGKGNWNELMENSVPGTSNLIAWGNDNPNSVQDDSDWAKNKRKLTKEMIASSSPFRILVEMGFKEEDVENSLRNTNLNLQESIEELRLNTLKETGVEIDRRKHQAQNSPIQGPSSINNILQRNNATAAAAKIPNQSAFRENAQSSCTADSVSCTGWSFKCTDTESTARTQHNYTHLSIIAANQTDVKSSEWWCLKELFSKCVPS